MKLKKGDIVLNRWAGHVECRYFVFVGKSGGMTNGIEFTNGRLKNIQYYSNHLNEPFHDGEPAFKIVGRTTAFDVMAQELKTFQQKESEESK